MDVLVLVMTLSVTMSKLLGKKHPLHIRIRHAYIHTYILCYMCTAVVGVSKILCSLTKAWFPPPLALHGSFRKSGGTLFWGPYIKDPTI